MNVWTRAKQGLSPLYRETAEMDVLDLATRLTLILLLLYAGDYWYVRVPMTVVCACGLIFRSLYRSAAFWFVLTTVMAAGNFYNWFWIDNHKYLMTYWCLALYCSLRLPDPRGAIALNARLLIGLCFLFATIWKLISDDYLDGTFFHETLLVDRRFGDFSRIFGGISEQTLFQNRLRLGELKSFDATLVATRLEDTPRLGLLATLSTWWTIGMEALLAAAFLWPAGRHLSRWRDGLLLVFAITTYSVATVVGFGWLLMVMGAAQCGPGSRSVRFLYTAVFFLIQIYTTPWLSVVTDTLSLESPG